MSKQAKLDFAIWVLENYTPGTVNGTPVDPEMDERVKKTLKEYIILVYPEIKEIIDEMPIGMALQVIGVDYYGTKRTNTRRN